MTWAESTLMRAGWSKRVAKFTTAAIERSRAHRKRTRLSMLQMVVRAQNSMATHAWREQ